MRRWKARRRPDAHDRPEWVVGPPAAVDDGPWRGVRWDVDGTPITVSVLDHDPAAPPEAVLTALVPAALDAGATLRTDLPVDPTWSASVGRATALMAGWWGHAATSPVRAPAGRPRRDPPAAGVAQCFTAGADSFWALLHGGREPTHLLYVLGYDVALDDAPRATSQLDAVRAVAEARGLEALVVRTDLRQHPNVPFPLWEKLHGAALAGAAMVASGVVGRLLVPPSYGSGRLVPWGSRPDLDPLWSVPGVLEVEHCATPLPRLPRVQQIAGEPLVQQHLRVCWSKRHPTGNCGTCEKCVRTMAQVATTPHLPAMETLPGREDLPALVRALHPLPPHHLRMWRDLRGVGLPPEVAAAVEEVAGDEVGGPGEG